MSERGTGKSRKAPVSKSPASRTSGGKGASTKAAVAKGAAKASRAAPKGDAPGATKGPSRLAKQAASSGLPLDAPSLMARVLKLENERDRLELELSNALSRIRLLEESREQVVNRIDWVIDSLRNLIDE